MKSSVEHEPRFPTRDALLHRLRLPLILGLVLLATGEARAVEDPATEEPATKPAGTSWIDTGRGSLNERADALANWADSFFGNTRSVEDAASSIIRIRPQFEWDEQDDNEWKIRATGRLYLPQASERLSVVFLGQDDDFEDEFYDPPTTASGDSSLAFEYQVRDRKAHKAYLFAGVKAGPKGQLGARYRYQAPFLDRNRFRFSEELFWVGGDGFGTLTRVDIDRTLSSSTLVRWANRAEYSEESNGIEWDSRIAWIKRLEPGAAFRAFTFIRGETDPELLKSRGFGIGYRRQFLRDWLYWEIEPRYAWRKRRDDNDREGVAMVKLRLEAIIGER